MKTLLMIGIVFSLAGCQSEPPRIVTRTVQVEHTSFVPLDPGLLPSIDAAVDPSTVKTNGQMFQAWQHDASQLGICKPSIDGIRALQPAPAPASSTNAKRS